LHPGTPSSTYFALLGYRPAVGGVPGYTFEWPFFAAVALYMFRKFLIGDCPKIPRPDLKELAKDEDN